MSYYDLLRKTSAESRAVKMKWRKAIPEGWIEQFETALQIYFRTLIDEGESFAYVQRVATLMMSGNAPLKLAKLTAELDTYRVNSETAKHPDIQRGWSIVNQFLQTYGDEFARLNLLVILGGSMIYDDPINLDLDIAFFSSEDQGKPLFDQIDLRRGEMDAVWGREFNNELNPYSCSIGKLKSHCQAFYNSNRRYMHNNGVDIDLDFSEASLLFTGDPIFQAQPGMMDNFRVRVLTLADQIPLLRAHMLVTLEDTLSYRLERRTM